MSHYTTLDMLQDAWVIEGDRSAVTRYAIADALCEADRDEEAELVRSGRPFEIAAGWKYAPAMMMVSWTGDNEMDMFANNYVPGERRQGTLLVFRGQVVIVENGTTLTVEDMSGYTLSDAFGTGHRMFGLVEMAIAAGFRFEGV